jgi:hypothetical protein
VLDRELANRPGEPYQVLAPSRVASDYKKDLAELKVAAHAACVGIGWMGGVGVGCGHGCVARGCVAVLYGWGGLHGGDVAETTYCSWRSRTRWGVVRV